MNKALKIIKELRIALGMVVKLEQMKLADGVTVIEADVFEADMEVFVVTEDDQKIAVPVGEYELEDGRILVVTEEGIIAEIKEAATEEEAPVEEEEVEAATVEPTAPKKTIEVQSVSKETFFSQEDMDVKDAEIIELKAQIELESVKPIVHNPETEVKEQINLSSKGRITEFLNNIKN